MIYAVDVTRNCPFSWKAELFTSSDRAYDFKAEMTKHNVSQGWKFRYVIVEFVSVDEAYDFYEGRVSENF